MNRTENPSQRTYANRLENCSLFSNGILAFTISPGVGCCFSIDNKPAVFLPPGAQCRKNKWRATFEP